MLNETSHHIRFAKIVCLKKEVTLVRFYCTTIINQVLFFVSTRALYMNLHLPFF